LAAYALPLAVGLAAQSAHGLEHTLGWLHGLERRAAAMGVAHLHDVPADDPTGDRVASAFVHAHGGGPHAHDAGIGALLVAADEADEHADETITAPLELATHLPATATAPLLVSVERDLADAGPAPAAPRNLLPPPLPPPRA
jgi:hypothetical protein